MRAYPVAARRRRSATRTPFVDGGITLQTFCLAVLAGQRHHLDDPDAERHRLRRRTGRSSPSFTAFILAGLGLAHSILDSLLIFCALHTGHAPFGYLDWLGWFGWTVLGNMVGGIGLVTLLRLIRSRELLRTSRPAVRRRRHGHRLRGQRQPRTA